MKPKLKVRKFLRSKPVNSPKFIPELNRSALGAELGIGRAHISRIFAGKITPGTRLMRKLADALGVSLDDMDKILRDIRRAVEVQQNAVRQAGDFSG
jgi:transcriptional regulator with XRE-family HTH domain